MEYKKGFVPYAFAAFLVGIVGGFSSVLGPAFVSDIGIPYANTTWTALAQAISTAAFAPIWGKAADRLGRRRTLLLGVVLFTLGNVFSALSSSLAAMLPARFLVGLGSAAIAPAILSYIVTQFPPNRVAKGFSLYMLISAASVIFGPTLGGLMIEHLGWRAMLWVCVTISAGVFVVCFFTAQKSPLITHSLSNFDLRGALMVFLFFGLLLCVPSFGQNLGWNSVAFLSALFGTVISLILLIVAEKHAKQPLLPFSFLKRKSFLLSMLALFFTQGLLQASMTNTIVFMNYVQPASTHISGGAISVMYLGLSLGAVVLGPLADRYPPKRILVFSLLIAAAGVAFLPFFQESTAPLLLFVSLALLGFGLGANGTIFMKVVLNALPQGEIGSATGTYGLFRDLAAPFGVAVLVPMFTNRITALIRLGLTEAAAAVNALRLFGRTGFACILGGMITVLFLPKHTQ